MKSKQRENDCIADEFSSDNCPSHAQKRKMGRVGQWEAPQGINFYLSFFFTNKKQLRNSTGKLGDSQIYRAHQREGEERETGGDEELDPWYNREEYKENHMQERTIEQGMPRQIIQTQKKHTKQSDIVLHDRFIEDGQKQFDIYF